MTVGETKNISLKPDEAYGPHREEAVKDMPKSTFPEDFQFIVGGVITGQAPTGQPMMATVLAEKEDAVTLDFNHPMAGKDLNFKIELVEINNNETEGD